jgi:hypothetical protein
MRMHQAGKIGLSYWAGRESRDITRVREEKKFGLWNILKYQSLTLALFTSFFNN